MTISSPFCSIRISMFSSSRRDRSSLQPLTRFRVECGSLPEPSELAASCGGSELDQTSAGLVGHA